MNFDDIKDSAGDALDQVEDKLGQVTDGAGDKNDKNENHDLSDSNYQGRAGGEKTMTPETDQAILDDDDSAVTLDQPTDLEDDGL